MRPSIDEFVHGRTGWRSEANGFSIEVRWGGFSTEEPDGHWWWSVCLCEDQLSKFEWDALQSQTFYWVGEKGVDSFENHRMRRVLKTSTEVSMTRVEFVKMSKRARGQSAALAEKEAREFCLLLLKEFPGRKVWDDTKKRYVEEQEK